MQPPYKICSDEKLGRHLVATRLIPRGDVVIQEAPLVRAPFFHTCPVCLGCGKIASSNCRPCQNCGWPVCDEVCEKSSNHIGECTLTQARGSKISIKNFDVQNPNYQFVAILRALALKKSSPEIWRKLMSLQSHSIDVNLAPPSFIRQLFKLEDWSEDEIVKVSEVLIVNGHELPLTRPSQLVVYDVVSFLEHSCKANCTKTFTNTGDVLVIAAEDIKEGQHLSICYTDPLWGVQNRRQHLHQTKRFWCSCCRCEDPTDFGTHLNTMKCWNSSCPGDILPRSFLQITNWFCGTCDSTVLHDEISLLLEKIGVEVSTIPRGDPKACKQFLEKYEHVLGASHFYMIDVKLALSCMLSSENYEDLKERDLNLLLRITEEVINIVDKVAPAEIRLLGLLWYRRAKSRIEIARRSNDHQFNAVLQESKKDFDQAQLFLFHEPTLLPEGRLRLQIGLEMKLIDDLLKISK